ncbi:TMV resistance protein N-like isoform X4 [Lycium barbarum]|uniref:TMV resistance protein N-like isoform X4 n=1 Tax=Lycium barbarum TaxID=112863 RepID=UPI00293E937B|nr:TMV resistance protein N-like isoform X4 [Lycium barbarum]
MDTHSTQGESSTPSNTRGESYTFFKFFCDLLLCFRDHHYDRLRQDGLEKGIKESNSSMDNNFAQAESSISSNTRITQGESSTSSKFFYEVFLSFSGEDTRKTFVSHLDHRLRQYGFQIFKDDKSLRKGDVISPALEEGIEKSRISIVVLSTNYASSRWCLDELVKILECKEKLNQRVMPIFYDVLPTEVRKQTGKFGTEFAKLKKKCGAQRMEEWKAALTEVANLSGSELRELANRVPRR